MAQRIVQFEHGKARSGLDLAFLVLVTLVALFLTAGGDERALAFASPQSPVPPAGDRANTVLSVPVVSVSGPGADAPMSAIRRRAGIGLIVLGAVLVIGGLFWIIQRSAPASPERPDEPGESAR